MRVTKQRKPARRVEVDPLIVHHLDGNPYNNDLKNLRLMHASGARQNRAPSRVDPADAPLVEALRGGARIARLLKVLDVG